MWGTWLMQVATSLCHVHFYIQRYVHHGLDLRKQRNLIEIGWERGMCHDQVSVLDMMAAFSVWRPLQLKLKHVLQSCILNACSPATDTELEDCGDSRN